MIVRCPVCFGDSLHEIFHIDHVPIFLGEVHRPLQSSLQSAYTAIDFVQCTTCEFVFNRCYKYLDYKTEYEVSRFHSDVFKEYLSNVIERIISNIEHEVNSVVEVGAGDCHFAEEFKKLNKADYFAVDNSWSEDTLPVVNGISCEAGTYDQSMTLNPDLVILRHVLEHVSKSL